MWLLSDWKEGGGGGLSSIVSWEHPHRFLPLSWPIMKIRALWLLMIKTGYHTNGCCIATQHLLLLVLTYFQSAWWLKKWCSISTMKWRINSNDYFVMGTNNLPRVFPLMKWCCASFTLWVYVNHISCLLGEIEVNVIHENSAIFDQENDYRGLNEPTHHLGISCVVQSWG